MYIEIEHVEVAVTSITSKKNEKTYYIVEQPALLFSDTSRYPEHFNIRHLFTEKESEARAVSPLARGRYNLTDKAYEIDRNKTIQLNLNFNTLRIAPVSAIPKQAAG